MGLPTSVHTPCSAVITNGAVDCSTPVPALCLFVTTLHHFLDAKAEVEVEHGRVASDGFEKVPNLKAQ
jgi:hypothetical protein